MGFLDFLTTKREPVVQTLELKKAFDAARFGIAGVPQYPDTDRQSLAVWERRNEVVFACIRKKCEAASDPELIVETRNRKGEWETYDGHQLTALLEKPNPIDTWDTFMWSWIASEEITGDFYAEIVRGPGNVPVQLWPLDPSCMFIVPDAKGGISHYEFRSGYAPLVRLEVKDVLHRRRPALGNTFYGQSPLAVAIGSVDADKAQTDYVRAFFHSDGIPAGVLKVAPGKAKSKEDAQALQQSWMAKYRRGGAQYKQIAVLDSETSFEKIGTNLKEIESEVTRGQIETRICMVFGVPPALIGAYVGLKLATNNATMKTHMADFWLNTMSPMLKTMRTFLSWELLPEFEDIGKIRGKQVRVNWDMTQVMAMQEDDNARHSRARDNFAAGMWTINEARDATGQEPLKDDYFVSPVNVEAITEAVRLVLASQPPQQPAQLQQGQDPNTVDGEVVNEPPPKQIGDGKTLPLAMPVKSVVTQPATVPAIKTFDYEGITLSREPNAFEMHLDIKALNDAYDSEKGRLNTLLVNVRNDLIKQAGEVVTEHDASDIYQLTLTPPSDAAKKLRKEIENAVKIGRGQVAAELAKQVKALATIETKDKESKIAGFISDLVDILIARTVSEIQKRTIDLFAILKTLGLSKEEIVARLEKQLDEQSVKVFESFASQTANAAINAGRDAEAEDRSADWNTVEYSAILDKNTCGPCEEADGKTATDPNDLPDAPNPDCEGGALCRCFHVYIFDEANA